MSSLYIGFLPFLILYTSYTAFQFSIYEKIFDVAKKKTDKETFEKNELLINSVAGLVSGSVSAALTNSIEVITVMKQTNPDVSIRKVINEQRFSLLTRGLLSRVVVNGGQSFILFNLLRQAGKVYNVELTD